MEPKQPINATLADSGKDGVEVEPESPSQLPSLTSGVRKPAFTPPQVDELRHQSLVLKYLVAGLPVPFHLILPIWKSVAKSFGSDNGGIYNHYPSFIGFSRFDYCQMMDPEPGRCRRTDGKKWRCSKDVVPDQKYCERHMHRGRQRSRNLVVASGIASELNKSPNSYNTITVTNPSVHTDMKSNPSTSNPVNLELATPSSNACNDNVVLEKNLMIVTTVHQTRHIGTTERKKNILVVEDSARTTIGSLPSSGGNNVSSRNNNKHIDDNQSGNTESGQIFSCFGDGAKSTVGGLPINGANHGSGSNSNGGDGNCSGNGQINSRINFKESSRNDDEHGSFVGHVTGFYTKSFLKGCDSSPYIDYWNAPEANMQRCRRTDGKNGGVAGMLFLIRSTVDGTSTEVQRSS
ncbi:hypothetical protein NMG60_11029126 [Bertholletia excelsa]